MAPLLLCLLLAGPVAADPAVPPSLLADFDADGLTPAVTAVDAQVAPSDRHVTAGRRSLEVTFGVATWPHISLPAGSADTVTDWRPYGAMMLDVFNPEAAPLRLGVRIDDDPTADGTVHCRQTAVDIPPGRPVVVWLALLPNDPGMRGLPPGGGGEVNASLGTRPLDLGHVIAAQLFLSRPPAPRRLYVDNVRLVPGPTFARIVDRFGQYEGGTWPGKVQTEADLQARREQERAELQASPRPGDRDEWGGWLSGPQLEATGWFRTQKWEGKWWLVDPAGRLFWSAGMDCVRPDNNGPIAGREALFASLPALGDPLHAFGGLGSRSVNFYGMNLQRKYGPDWPAPWLEMTRNRLLAWGFNTLGNWCDDRSYRDLRLPFTVPIGTQEGPAFAAGWRSIADCYSDRWAAAAEARIRIVTARWNQDPLCLGYFVDNELSWGGWGGDGRYALPLNALQLGADREVKQAFTRLLQARYADIAALNRAWGTNVASWEALLSQPVAPAGPRSPAAEADLAMLLSDFARRYFGVVGALLRKCAPHQLYLGARFAVAPDEVALAARDHCDVVSYNIYGRAPMIDARAAQIAMLDRPVLIGEFHFGALDRGMFHAGLGPVRDQAARGAEYAAYVGAALSKPWCVGAHWFEYVDQALTGRFDGENYNIGFVSGTDTPYPELVAGATPVNCTLYQRRGGTPDTVVRHSLPPDGSVGRPGSRQGHKGEGPHTGK